MSETSVKILNPLDLQGSEASSLLDRVHGLALKQARDHVSDRAALPPPDASRAIYAVRLAGVLGRGWSSVAYVRGPGGEGFLNLSAAAAVTRDTSGGMQAIKAVQVDDMTTMASDPADNSPVLGFSTGSIAAAIAACTGAKALIWECDRDSLSPYYNSIGASERRERSFRFAHGDIVQICAADNPGSRGGYSLRILDTPPSASSRIGNSPESIGLYDGPGELIARALVFPRVSVIREVGGQPSGVPEGHIGVQIEGMELIGQAGSSPEDQAVLLDRFMRLMTVFFKENIEDFGFADLVVDPEDPAIAKVLKNFNVGLTGYTGTSRLWILQGDGFQRAALASSHIKLEI